MSRELKIIDGKINFSCRMEHCQHCCCKTFEGLTDKISSIDKRPFDEIILTEEDRMRIYESGYPELIDEAVSPITGRVYYRMNLHPDGTCKAYRNGRCNINSFKPTLCKAFPFYFDMFTGLCGIMCEGFTEDCKTDLRDCKESFEAARKMYEYWIDFYMPDGE